MPKYSIGVDFGTLSGRAVIIDVADGRELATASYDYPNGVMDQRLPDGIELGHDWALQHPEDYLDALGHVIPEVLRESGVSPGNVVGLGTDFTACTLLPVKADGTPLCLLPAFKHNPHAYVKLWKHHAAQDKANRLNEIAASRGEKWLSRYGGKISSEWAVPKIWQVLDEAPEVYAAADYFIEAADWIIWQLTGRQSRNSCTAGYKAIWHKQDGYPSEDFFAALDPRLRNLIRDKLNWPVSPLGDKAGRVSPSAAKLTNLTEETTVAIGNVDAHVTVPALGIDGPGKLLAIMGTSTCHILLGTEEKAVPGMCGVVEDGVYPGYYGYEAGQSCVGDHFAWFIENCLPAAYINEAAARKQSIYAHLREKSERLRPGESGLVALDWWNGNRSVLVDADLSGTLVGMTLQTKPEEMYRALIEATAYGTRMIVETFRDNGVPVNEFYASGGISQKDPMAMRIYADVLNMPVKIGGSAQSPALGSAIFGAVAAGVCDIFTAARRMGKLNEKVYMPDPNSVKVYDSLYAEYKTLHDYFGQGANDVMKRLKSIKKGYT